MLMDVTQTPRRLSAKCEGWHADENPPRVYEPRPSRFLQPDPIGYEDGLNWYGYVGGDPVNRTDPSGTREFCFSVTDASTDDGETITTHSHRQCVDVGEGRYSYPATYGGGGGGVPTTPSTPTVVPQKSVLCQAVGLLGNTGRLRLGADAAGGMGGFLKGGFGVSLRGDLSIEFDAYGGAGVGGGVYGGGGLSIDGAGGQGRGFNTSTTGEFTGGFGVPIYGPIGAGPTVSIPTHVDRNGNVIPDPAQASGGIGFGPKYGLFAGYSYATTTYTYRTSGLCS